jgi:hypothetical protein
MVRSIVWGTIIILIGVWLLFAQLYPSPETAPVLAKDWPIVIVTIGLAALGDGIIRGARRHKWGRAWWGAVVTLVGTWIWASNRNLLDAYQFSKTWPALIVLLGIYILVKGTRRWSRRHGVRKVDVIADLENGRINADQAVERLKKSSV